MPDLNDFVDLHVQQCDVGVHQRANHSTVDTRILVPVLTGPMHITSQAHIPTGKPEGVQSRLGRRRGSRRNKGIKDIVQNRWKKRNVVVDHEGQQILGSNVIALEEKCTGRW